MHKVYFRTNGKICYDESTGRSKEVDNTGFLGGRLLNALILENHEATAQQLGCLVKTVSKAVNIISAGTYEEAETLIEQERFDIGLLTVGSNADSKEKDVMALAKRLVGHSPQIKLIFLADNPGLAMKAYEVHAFDFLIQPIDPARLESSLRAALQSLESRLALEQPKHSAICANKLFVRMNKEMLLLPYEDILFIEKVEKDVVIHTGKERYSVKWTLSELEAQLPKSFVRTHRSYIVNSEKIVKISEFGDRTYEVEFEVPRCSALMSRYKINELFEVLNVPLKE